MRMQEDSERQSAAKRLESVFRPNEIKRTQERHLIQSAIILLQRDETNDAIAYELGLLAIAEHAANRQARRDLLEWATRLLTAPLSS